MRPSLAVVASAAGESSAGLLGRISDWAVGLMELLGGPGAGLVIALENLFPPLPSEAILPLAGFTASRGTFTLAEALAWTTAGSLVGALALYALGATVGYARLRAIAVRLPLVEGADLDRANDWFAHYGRRAVFLGRMVPLVRSFISVPAGVQRMPLGQFVLLTTVGSAIWNSVLILSGYLLGEQWVLVERYAGIFSRVVVVSGALVLLVLAVLRWRKRWRRGP